MSTEQNENVTNNDIFGLLKQVFSQNAEIKTDINKIKEKLDHQNNTVLELTRKVTELQGENYELKNRLRKIEREVKKNNIIIFGFPESENQNVAEQVKVMLNDKLNITLNDQDISNVYRIGAKQQDKKRAVIVELVRNTVKQNILKNTFKLKGSGISLTNDLTPEQQSEQKILRTHLKQAREKKLNAKIISNKLLVNGELFTIEQLKNQEEAEIINIEEGRGNNVNNHIIQKNHSAPGTPTTQQLDYSEGQEEKEKQGEEEGRIKTNNNIETTSRTTTRSLATRKILVDKSFITPPSKKIKK